MTVLELATLTSTSLCYEYKNFEFNQPLFDDLLSKLSNSTYSLPLQGLIKMMLVEDPETRITPLEIFQYIKPFEAQILARQPFEF